MTDVRRAILAFVVLTVVGMTFGTAFVGSVAADHSEGDPPDDPGNNASEVPGVGRPPCIPPSDPGHGQPNCIPPDHANNPPIANQSNGDDGNPGQGNGNGGGNGNAGGNGNGGSSSAQSFAVVADVLGL